MAVIADGALDAALAYIRTNGTTIWICNADPTTYAAAETGMLGAKTSMILGATADSVSPAGRKASYPSISDGTVTTAGTASHWAAVNTVAEILAASGPLSANKTVSLGSVFTLDAITITMLDGTTV